MKDRKNKRPAGLRLAGLVMVITIFMLWLVPITVVWAFKPKNSSGGRNPGDSTHQSITEDAIKEADQEFFGITNLTKSMKKAMDDIASADAAVDVNSFFDSPHHFDAESFAAGQNLLISEFNST